MSMVTKNLLRGIDYEQIKKERERNFGYLHEHLRTINRLELCLPDGPYMYPLLVKDGAKLRMSLREKNIYIPTLWPNVIESLTPEEIEYGLAEDILPLPCDQRYDLKDMQYLAKEVYRCLS